MHHDSCPLVVTQGIPTLVDLIQDIKNQADLLIGDLYLVVRTVALDLLHYGLIVSDQFKSF